MKKVKSTTYISKADSIQKVAYVSRQDDIDLRLAEKIKFFKNLEEKKTIKKKDKNED
jgi:hypothetical protein